MLGGVRVLPGREREIERDKDKKRGRERQRNRDTETQRHRNTEREREIEREREGEELRERESERVKAILPRHAGRAGYDPCRAIWNTRSQSGPDYGLGFSHFLGEDRSNQSDCSFSARKRPYRSLSGRTNHESPGSSPLQSRRICTANLGCQLVNSPST